MTLTAAENLHQTALNFWMMHDLYDDLTAQIHKVRRVRLPSVGLFVSPLSVRYFFGIARKGIYKSRVVDVQQNIQAVVAPSFEARFEYMSQSGIYGSYLENTIIEQLFDYELGRGVSATQVFWEANEQQIPIYAITSENIDTVLPLLAVSSEVKTDIVNAIHAGKHAIVPQREIVHGNWQGSGYIIQDSITGAGAYLLEGGLRGGALEGLSCEASKNPMVAAMKMVIQIMDLYFAIVAMMSFGSFAAAAVALTAFQAMVKTLLKAVVKKQIKKKRAKKRKQKKRTECDCGTKKKRTRKGQSGQDECGPELRLVSVEFLNDLDIYKDQAGKAPKIDWPQWQDTKKPFDKPEINERIGYVSSKSGNSKTDCQKKTATCLTITAKFKVTRLPEKWKDKSITIRGEVSGSSPDNKGTEKRFKTELRDTIKLPKKLDGVVEIEKVMSENALPSKITQYYDPMTIKWKLSYGKEVDEIQTSKHKVYVTLDKPGNKPNELYLTVLHLATSNPGATNEADAAWKTWQLFANVEKPDIGSKSLGPKGVKNWDDIPLAYYPPNQGLWQCPHSLKDFLQGKTDPQIEKDDEDYIEGDKDIFAGRCGVFSALLRETLKVNQVDSKSIVVKPRKESKGGLGGFMLIKKWQLKEKDARYPEDTEGYKWHFDWYKTSMVSAVRAGKAGADGKTYGDILNILDGLPGQNVKTPSEKAFINHAIVEVLLPEKLKGQLKGKRFFDPSYGKTYSGEKDFEKQAVDGYGREIYEKNNPVYYNYEVRRSKGANNIIFE